MALIGSPQISLITLCIVMLLFAFGYRKSGLRGVEQVYNEILNLFLLSFTSATAIVLAITVAVAIVSPELLADPQGTLYSAGIIGAGISVLWAFVVFWRQIALLRIKVGQLGSPQEKKAGEAQSTETKLVRTSSVVMSPPMPSLIGVPNVEEKLTEWLGRKLPDFRNAFVTTLVVADSTSGIEVRGVAQDSALLPYKFSVKFDSKGRIDDKRSRLK